MAPAPPTVSLIRVTETDLPRLCELVNDPAIARCLDQSRSRSRLKTNPEKSVIDFHFKIDKRF